MTSTNISSPIRRPYENNKNISRREGKVISSGEVEDIAKYRKKPIVIEAFRWTGDEHQIEDPDWACIAIAEGLMGFVDVGTPKVCLQIKTLEGVMTANRGDWIIKGIKGELYPCKPDIFEATYEKTSDQETI